MHKTFPEDPDIFAAESRITWFMAAYVAVGSVAAGVRAGWRAAAGFALGGLLSYGNFRWLKASVDALLQRSTEGLVTAPEPTAADNIDLSATTEEAAGAAPVPSASSGSGALRFVGRFALMAAILYAIYVTHSVAFWAVLVGLFAVVAGIMAEAAYETWRVFTRG